MSLREDTIRQLTEAGFRYVGTLNGRVKYQNGSRKVLLPPGDAMTKAQQSACLSKALHDGTPRASAEKKRRADAERKAAEERAAIGEEILERERRTFGALAEGLTSEQMRDLRRRMRENDSEDAAAFHLMTEWARTSERARHRA